MARRKVSEVKSSLTRHLRLSVFLAIKQIGDTNWDILPMSRILSSSQQVNHSHSPQQSVSTLRRRLLLFWSMPRRSILQSRYGKWVCFFLFFLLVCFLLHARLAPVSSLDFVTARPQTALHSESNGKQGSSGEGRGSRCSGPP